VSGLLTGVGVGPGDPSLLTLKGRDALLAADALFVPVAEVDELGYAERVVTAHVPHATRIRRLVFDLDPAEREAAWRRAAEEVAAVVADGRHAAFATIGDPNVYSTFTYLAREVRTRVPEVAVATVPGITAMQDLASRSGTVLLEQDEQLTLLPFTAGAERLRAALAEADTVVLYKGGRRLPEIRTVIEEAGLGDHAVFGAKLGLPEEDVRNDLPDGPTPYLSTVIVTRRGREPGAPS
jgi:precorrin-2/cobalt-factor-2 C20-methyltransferase